MELSALLTRCRQGDPLAWELLVRQHQARIYGIAFAYVGNRDEARDLAQEIFLRVYRRLDSCRDPERFLAWMIRIARNACLDHLRRLKSRPPQHDVPIESMHSLSEPGPDAEELHLTKARRRLVHRALGSLSPLSSEIILLKDMQGLRLEEVAEMLDIPLGTAKSRSNRARLELAQVLRSLGGPSAAEASG